MYNIGLYTIRSQDNIFSVKCFVTGILMATIIYTYLNFIIALEFIFCDVIELGNAVVPSIMWKITISVSQTLTKIFPYSITCWP